MSNTAVILPKINRPKSANDRWFIFYSVKDPQTGKKKRFRHYEGFAECKTKADSERNAQTLLRRYKRRLMKGWNPFEDKSKVIWEDKLVYKNNQSDDGLRETHQESVSHIINDYLESKIQKGVSRKSIQCYQAKFRIFREWLVKEGIENIAIDEFNENHAASFLKYLNTNRKGSTMNDYKTQLSGTWRFAAKKHEYLINIWLSIEKYKEKVTPYAPLPIEILKKVKGYTSKNDLQLWLSIQMLYYTFIRPKEMRLLKVGNIDLIRGKITLPAEITKSGHYRIVDIQADFLEFLKNTYQIGSYPESYYIFSTSGKPSLKICGRDYLSKRFAKLREKLGISEDYKFYGLKHTGAVVAIMNGANIIDLKNQIGHQSLEDTNEYMKSLVGYESNFFKKKMPKI